LNDDPLWRQLKTVPAFRALLRSVESRFYGQVDLAAPVLDLGCGDGHFAAMTFERPLAVGVDPWWGPLLKAGRSGAYHGLAQAAGDRLPFAAGSFETVISNSVLEHIPDVQPVLAEVSRVLRPGGRLNFTAPSHYFTEALAGAAFFERLRLPAAAHAYRRLFNRVSRHARTDPPQAWARRLALAGLTVERWQYYFSRGALRALEVGHIQGLPSAVLHFLTGHWIVAPWRCSLRPTEQWLRPYYQEVYPEVGAMIAMLAIKDGPGPDRPLPAPSALAAEPLTYDNRPPARG
jgi:SAM-dependent methyltransferase